MLYIEIYSQCYLDRIKHLPIRDNVCIWRCLCRSYFHYCDIFHLHSNTVWFFLQMPKLYTHNNIFKPISYCMIYNIFWKKCNTIILLTVNKVSPAYQCVMIYWVLLLLIIIIILLIFRSIKLNYTQYNIFIVAEWEYKCNPIV